MHGQRGLGDCDSAENGLNRDQCMQSPETECGGQMQPLFGKLVFLASLLEYSLLDLSPSLCAHASTTWSNPCVCSELSLILADVHEPGWCLLGCNVYWVEPCFCFIISWSLMVWAPPGCLDPSVFSELSLLGSLTGALRGLVRGVVIQQRSVTLFQVQGW